MSLTSYRAAPPRVGGGGGVLDPARRPGGDRLSRALWRSTMGAGAFHGRVRDGIGCAVPAMATGPPRRIRGIGCVARARMRVHVRVRSLARVLDRLPGSVPRGPPVAAARRCARRGPAKRGRPRRRCGGGGDGVVVAGALAGACWSAPVSCREPVRAIRTARLRASLRLHLRPIHVLVWHGPRGDLVWRGVSRLDAFSGYPVRAWLPGGAAGATTGAPEARPSRSSRTGDGASQVSCTHGR